MMSELKALFNRLLDHFGEQGWWPGETRFEVMIGAILTQNVSWLNVERAIDNMKEEGIMEPGAIRRVEKERLQELIKPTGFYRQKTERLKRLVRVIERYGSLDEFLQIEDLRSVLLNIKGIGSETADSILLYAADRPHFVVDAYTKRILERRQGIEGNYQEIKSIFDEELEESVPLYKEYHALLVELGKNYCKKNPSCEGCPVRDGCSYGEGSEG